VGPSIDNEARQSDTRLPVYGIANLYYDFAGNTVTELARVDLTQANDARRHWHRRLVLLSRRQVLSVQRSLGDHQLD
jgi:hypothetical protein